MGKRSQTATEYIIVLGIVLLITLIVVGVLGGFPSIGTNNTEAYEKLQLKQMAIAVNSYYINDTYVEMDIQNNNDFMVVVKNASVDDKYCFTKEFPKRLKPKKKDKVICVGHFKNYTKEKKDKEKRVPKFGFEYKNADLGSIHQTEHYSYDTIDLTLSSIKNDGGIYFDEFRDIIVVDDGFVTVGLAASDLNGFPGGSTNYGGSFTRDFLIAKYDKNLNLERLSNPGGTIRETFSSLIESEDGFITVGSSNSNLNHLGGFSNSGDYDFVIAKFNKNDLSIDSLYNFGGSASDWLYKIIESGDYYIAVGSSGSDLSSFTGGSTNTGQTDFVIARFNKNDLSLDRINNFGGTGSENFMDIIDIGNYYIVVGSSESDLSSFSGGSTNLGQTDFVIAKINKTDLSVESLKNFGGTTTDTILSINEYADDYYLSGSSSSDLSSFTGGTTSAGGSDITFMKLDSNFNILKLINFGGSNSDTPYDISIYNEYLYFVGTTVSPDLSALPGGNPVNTTNDFITGKVKLPDLELERINNFGGAGSDYYWASVIEDGILYAAGYSGSDLSAYPDGDASSGSSDFVISRFD